MSSQSFFPMSFISLAKSNASAPDQEEGVTMPAGVYLRWFVKPYLGTFGITPLTHSEVARALGYRLFWNPHRESPPGLDPISPEPVGPGGSASLGFYPASPSALLGIPGARTFYHPAGLPIQAGFDLSGYSTPYVQFNYFLFKGQKVRLTYGISDAAGNVRATTINLDYPRLSLADAEYEVLSYAVRTERPGESVRYLVFECESAFVVWDFRCASPQAAVFYQWTEQNSPEWTEIEPAQYLFPTLNAQLIGAADAGVLLRAISEFYQVYYGRLPAPAYYPNQVRFSHPLLPQFALPNPLVREYFADQYDDLCKGRLGDKQGEKLKIHPQDAGAYASLDPAIAYALGLFRVLVRDELMGHQGVFKVQGAWPDGKRFCAYSVYSPTNVLGEPNIASLGAVAAEMDRVLLDYRTFRTHHPLNGTDLSWPKGNTAAFLIVRSGLSGPTCVSPFWVPRQEDDKAGTIHFSDWRDGYSGTAIPKVLDGEYQYHISGFDIFGQMSPFVNAICTVQPQRLQPGEIQKPEITLLDPSGEAGNPGCIDIPLTVTPEDSGYSFPGYNDATALSFNVTFFWPPESRYLWSKQRGTGAPSLDHFCLWYVADVPAMVPVSFEITEITADHLKISLPGVMPAPGRNEALFRLIDKLIRQPWGAWPIAEANAVVTGGTLSFGCDLKITGADMGASTLTTRGTASANFGSQQLITGKKLEGLLYWNREANMGGFPIGWHELSGAGEAITPPAPIDFAGPLGCDYSPAPPGPPVPIPTDLLSPAGLAVYATPDNDQDYTFTIKIPANHPLSAYRRLYMLPFDPTSKLEPGEYPISEVTGREAALDIPAGVNTLFSTARIHGFYLARGVPDGSAEVVFRGSALPFAKYLLYPAKDHQTWRFYPPVSVTKSLPLATLLDKLEFNAGNYLTTQLTVGIEAVMSGQDTEVRDTLQTPVATKKLSFCLDLPAPALDIPDIQQPRFGIPAGPPDYNGDSLIRIDRVFDLSKLESKFQYKLYRLETDSLAGGSVPIRYAKNPVSNEYQRDFSALRQALDTAKGTGPSYLAASAIQAEFEQFARNVEPQPLSAADFRKLVIALPGASRAAWLYAIRAYDPKSRKESSFAALSAPVYVEDRAAPRPAVIDYIQALLGSDSIEFQIGVRYSLNPSAGFGHATESDLNITPGLLGPCFPDFIQAYTLYVTCDAKVVALPDDGDFIPDPGDDGHHPYLDRGPWSVKLLPERLTLDSDRDYPEDVAVKCTLSLANQDAMDNLPSRLHFCLRGTNYLGQRGPLSLTPFRTRVAATR